MSTIAEQVADFLKSKKMSVSAAESCTGGLISHKITAVSGSSQWFLGAVIAYSNSVKEKVLGVSAEDIEIHGAVSETVVRQMAEGVRVLTGSSCSVATSGIAGPTGGTDEKPVGLVFIGVCNESEGIVKRFNFTGSRAEITEQAADAALGMLLKL